VVDVLVGVCELEDWVLLAVEELPPAVPDGLMLRAM